jgi:hypothetical protein
MDPSVSGEDQGEGGTGARAIGVRHYIATMGAGDPAGDGEPDSATTDACRISPVETFEDSLQISGGKAPSGVAYRQFDMTGSTPTGHLHRAAGGGISECIPEQVDDDLGKPVGVTAHPKAGTVNSQCDVLIIELGPEPHGNRSDQLAQVDLHTPG